MQKAIGKRKTDVRYSRRIERGEKSGENVFSHSQLTIHKTCTLYNITHKSAVDTIYNKKPFINQIRAADCDTKRER